MTIRTRQWWEAWEETSLAPYAQKSAQSVGRQHPEPPHPARTEYQRDCARVIHSQAFRRLEAKTQVFLSGTADHRRTRLTHTLEVVSISRSMARALALNEDLTEAIALAHDLGHPPFGHAGERALDEAMSDHGGFNHNTQSLRILERIEKKYPGIDGLNVTGELLEGLQKHRKQYENPRRAGGPHAHPSLEAQVANLADEIAYYSHDLDDAIDAGLLCRDDLARLEIWATTLEEVRSRYPALEGRELDAYVIRCMIDRMVEDVINWSAGALEAARPANVNAVRHHATRLISYSPPMREANRVLRAFFYRNLYFHPSVASMNERACAMLLRVFNHYLAEPTLMGVSSVRRIESDGLHRAVCDYLSGMTDRYLLEEYGRLFPEDIHHPGSLRNEGQEGNQSWRQG